jgi:hypothetical protein
VVAAAVGIALYYGRKNKEVEVEPAAQSVPAPANAEPPIQNPIADTVTEPLPQLSDSDPKVRDSLGELFGRSLDQYLVPQNIVRNIVATVDNLPRNKTAAQRWPIKPTAGEFVTTGEDRITLNENNYSRYEPLVTLMQNVDASQAAAVYRRMYPLFQQAYVDLGYPQGYFNDRLVEVIDHLLETPEVQGPIELTHPSVFYEFADPTLESRSAGQKLLIRMGSDNLAVVKEKLAELRREVAKQGAEGTADRASEDASD